MSILMMNLCFSTTAEPEIKTVASIPEVLKSIDTLASIIVSIVVIAGGILGFNYIRKLREKQVDSTFSYLTRLSIRLKYFREPRQPASQCGNESPGPAPAAPPFQPALQRPGRNPRAGCTGTSPPY